MSRHPLKKKIGEALYGFYIEPKGHHDDAETLGPTNAGYDKSKMSLENNTAKYQSQRLSSRFALNSLNPINIYDDLRAARDRGTYATWDLRHGSKNSAS